MLRTIGLAVLSTALTLGVLEILLRSGDLAVHDFVNEKQKYALLLYQDEVGGYYRHPANLTAVLGGVTVSFNSLGMRDVEPPPRRPGRPRVLCLGDSMVFGPAVAQDAIWPARLRRLLPDAEVLAAGVQGWNTVEEDHFLTLHVGEIDPDLLILLYVTNDNEPLEPWRREKQPPRTWLQRLYRVLVLRSRLFEWAVFVYKTRVVGADWAGIRMIQDWRQARRAEGQPFSPTEPGWLESRAALGHIADLARARGGRLAIFLYNMNGLPPAAEALARLSEFGAETGTPVFDTKSFFAGHDLVSITNAAYIDPHPNAAGHALLAEGVARTLRAAGLVPATDAAPAAP